MKIAIMACSSTKMNGTGPLYLIHSKSALFRFTLEYAQKNFDKVYAISGQYGLLDIAATVEDHNGSIDHIKYKAFKKWLIKTGDQINEQIPSGSELHFFAGNKYRRIIPRLKKQYLCYEPFKGVPIGKQLHFLKEKLKERSA